jgi:uncharacterized protein (DUF486 family)
MAEYHCLLFEIVLLQCINVLTTIRWAETLTHACADYTGMLLCSTGAFKVLNFATPVGISVFHCIAHLNPFQLFTALLIYSELNPFALNRLLQSSPLPSGSLGPHYDG